MKIQYCSDLHLEFKENKSFLKLNPLKPVGEILLLAGDIVPFAVMIKHDDFFSFVSDHFRTTYWIPGNHEYYYSDVAKKCGTFHESIKSNVYLVNNTAVQQDEIKLIFSTMWTKISPHRQWHIERGMNDFHVIKFNGSRFSAEHFNTLHEESLSFIKKELKQNSSPHSIVVSHHVPTFQHYPEKYKTSILNEAFAVELFDFIEAKGPDYWIYGHHHTYVPAYKIGKTNMLTNQLGYVQFNEGPFFDGGKVIEI